MCRIPECMTTVNMLQSVPKWFQFESRRLQNVNVNAVCTSNAFFNLV
jgi:hypothetical protein